MQRAKLVEPVHQLRADGGARVAPIWPGVEGLALASNAQIYPYLLNGDSVMGFAEGSPPKSPSARPSRHFVQ